MKKPFFLIAWIMIIAISGCINNTSENEETPAGQNLQLNWHTDLNAALEEAQKTNKPVFVDFYTNWCHYCKQLDETTFSDPQVQQKLADNYVLAKIDADKYPETATKYGIYGYPTLLFLNPDGHEKNRISGYVDAQTLINQL